MNSEKAHTLSPVWQMIVGSQESLQQLAPPGTEEKTGILHRRTEKRTGVPAHIKLESLLFQQLKSSESGKDAPFIEIFGKRFTTDLYYKLLYIRTSVESGFPLRTEIWSHVLETLLSCSEQLRSVITTPQGEPHAQYLHSDTNR